MKRQRKSDRHYWSSYQLTPPDAHNPDAVEALQRPITINMVYPYWMRCEDQREGRRDAADIQNAAQTAQANGETFTTPWLEAVGQEWLTGVEWEHSPTSAIFGIHDREIVRLEERRRALVGDHQHLEAEADGVAKEGPAVGSRTVQEEHADPAVIARRRGREHAARLAQHKAAAQAAVNQINEIDQQLAELHADRTTHWNGLLVRTAASRAFAERRRQTYLRAGLRKAHVKAPIPALAPLPAPDWLVSGIEPPVARQNEGVDHEMAA